MSNTPVQHTKQTASVDIVVNGKPQQVNAHSTLQDLAESLGLTGKRVAVEVNLAIIPRSQLALFRLNAGDRVEIVHAIGGG